MLLKQNKVPPGMKWFHFLQINLIDECFTQWGSQDCRWLVFGLELQGTDGKAAALMCLNRSTEPRLLVGFSSDIFFSVTVPCWITSESFQKLFPSFLYHTFSPLLILPLLSCLITGFSFKKAQAVSSCFCKATVIQEDAWRTEGDWQECAFSAPVPGTVGTGEYKEKGLKRVAQLMRFS